MGPVLPPSHDGSTLPQDFCQLYSLLLELEIGQFLSKTFKSHLKNILNLLFFKYAIYYLLSLYRFVRRGPTSPTFPSPELPFLRLPPSRFSCLDLR